MSKYYIKDESNQFCDRLSIYKVQGIYYYKSFPTFSNGCRRYTSKQKAQEVLQWLQAQNNLADFNHHFKIIEERKPLIQIKDSGKFSYKNMFTAYALNVPIKIQTDLPYDLFEKYIEGFLSYEEIYKLEEIYS